MTNLLFSAFLIASSICSYSFFGLFTALSKDEDGTYHYSTVMSSYVTESIKCLFSFIIFKIQCYNDKTIRKQFEVKEIFLWIIPAMLYCVANNLFYVIIEISDPVTAQVFGSLEIVIVGLFSVIILRKKILGLQWAALVLVCTSVAEIELGKNPNQTFEDFNFLAVFLSITSSSFAACAGVVIEKLMKNHKDMSFFQQSIWLYFWGGIVNISVLWIKNGRNFPYALTFRNFNAYSYLAILTSVFRGLITGCILKYLNSIVKSFASSFSLVVTSVISAVFIPGKDLSILFDLSVINLCIALYLYRTAGVHSTTTQTTRNSKGKKKFITFNSLPSEVEGRESTSIPIQPIHGSQSSDYDAYHVQIIDKDINNEQTLRGNTRILNNHNITINSENTQDDEEEEEYELRPTVRLQQK